MIIDTSAIIAILFNEDDADIFAQAIIGADSCRISAATFVETAIVVEAQTKNNGGRQLDAFIRRAGITIEPVTEEQAHIAGRRSSTSVRAGTALVSTMGIAFPTPSRRRRGNRCYSRERTSQRPT